MRIAAAGRRGLQAALGLAFAARLLPFIFGMEHYGDAPVRIEIAERWARAPHVWHGFAEAYQYGPMHLTLIGAMLRIFPDRFFAPRLLSLVAGLAGVWLLYRLTRRFQGDEAALLAGCGLALSPLHIQASTTGASEAVFLALLLAAIECAFDERALLAALALGVGGLVRYDGWLYVGLVGLLVWRTAGFWKALVFGAASAVPMAAWLYLNWKYTGDALAPIHHIDRDHLGLVGPALAYFGQPRYRALCLTYWPLALLLVFTPVLALAAMAGAFRALWTRARGWELAALAWVPALYFTLRGAVLLNFRPLARFTLVAGALSLPFAWSALQLLREPLRRAALFLTAVALVATPVALAALSYGRDGTAAEWARPLSPISTVPPGIAQAARFLRAGLRPDDTILLDGVWDYLDIPLAFAVDLPDERWLRFSWSDDFEARLLRHKPTVAVLLYQGRLRYDPRATGATEDNDRFRFDGTDFCLQRRFVYASIYRRCER